MNLGDPTHLEWRTAHSDDLSDLFEMLLAISSFDDTSQRWSLEELQEGYARSSDSDDESMLLGFDGPSLVAAGWNTTISGVDTTIRLDGAVHPAFRHQGIGRALFRWQLDRARNLHQRIEPESRLRLLGFADADTPGKRNLYHRFGLRPIRWFIDMVCTFPAPEQVDNFVKTPALGIRFTPLTLDLIEPTRDAHNEVFADRFGAQGVSPEEWAASLAREGARPELSWIAVDEFDRVVGYALNSVLQVPGMPGLGWTDRLGVRLSHRGRNIARILLARSLDSFRREGLESGGVGMDSVDGGGTELYRSLGYQATDTIIQYELLEPGAETESGEQMTKGRA